MVDADPTPPDPPEPDMTAVPLLTSDISLIEAACGKAYQAKRARLHVSPRSSRREYVGNFHKRAGQAYARQYETIPPRLFPSWETIAEDLYEFAPHAQITATFSKMIARLRFCEGIAREYGIRAELDGHGYRWLNDRVPDPAVFHPPEIESGNG